MATSDLHYGHPRMDVAERAKIFMPFDPLKGFREALAEREREADLPHDFASETDAAASTGADSAAQPKASAHTPPYQATRWQAPSACE